MSEKVFDGKKLEEQIYDAVNTAFQQVFQNAVYQIEDAYGYTITKYYNYKTKMYIRHGEKDAGTRKGSNLYNAITASFKVDGGDRYSISYGLDPNLLEEYTNSKAAEYKGRRKRILSISGEDRKEVLDVIKSGYRYNVGPWEMPNIQNEYSDISDINDLYELENEIDKQFSVSMQEDIARIVAKKIRI